MTDEIYDLLEDVNFDRKKSITFSFPYFMQKDDFIQRYEETTETVVEAGRNTFSREITGRLDFSTRRPEAYIRLDQESREYLKQVRENFRGASQEALARYALEPGFDEIDLGLEAGEQD